MVRDAACRHWCGPDGRYCLAVTGVRVYLTGTRCPAHTPAAVAGRPESTVEGQLAMTQRSAGKKPAQKGDTGLLTAALELAARGWSVFPLRPGDKRPAFPDHDAGRCTGSDPRCRAAGGHVT